MYVTEQFVSVQGEGTLTGVPSTFVRLGGCNLRCSWCDTPYSSWKPEGEHIPLDALVDDIARQGPRHVVLTGGEPMLQAGAVPLT
ncbi:MAG TPA: radical SAM protein, partial [Deltaproteobacteria bacterium]|nr:radical SAM protein [Deltaproteobacteria bacterium]